MGFINVNNLRFYYEIRGSGPRLLFIHGIWSDVKNPVGIFHSPMVEHFTVLAFDPRGIGESQSPSGPYAIADMADDAAGIAAALGWEKYHVFGASMGGMVGQELALRHPEAVDKLILGVTNAGEKSGVPVVIDKLAQMSTIEKLFTSDTRQDEAWAKAHPEAVAEMERQGELGAQALAANPALAKGYQYQVEAVIGHDTYDRLPQITAPTLVFNGLYDGSMALEFPRAMAARMPNARFHPVKHGHGSWYYDPAVWDMMIAFLKEE